jgi:hypothetical protein
MTEKTDAMPITMTILTIGTLEMRQIMVAKLIMCVGGDDVVMCSASHTHNNWAFFYAARYYFISVELACCPMPIFADYADTYLCPCRYTCKDLDQIGNVHGCCAWWLVIFGSDFLVSLNSLEGEKLNFLPYRAL